MVQCQIHKNLTTLLLDKHCLGQWPVSACIYWKQINVWLLEKANFYSQQTLGGGGVLPSLLETKPNNWNEEIYGLNVIMWNSKSVTRPDSDDTTNVRFFSLWFVEWIFVNQIFRYLSKVSNFPWFPRNLTLLCLEQLHRILGCKFAYWGTFKATVNGFSFTLQLRLASQGCILEQDSVPEFEKCD